MGPALFRVFVLFARVRLLILWMVTSRATFLFEGALSPDGRLGLGVAYSSSYSFHCGTENPFSEGRSLSTVLAFLLALEMLIHLKGRTILFTMFKVGVDLANDTTKICALLVQHQRVAISIDILRTKFGGLHSELNLVPLLCSVFGALAKMLIQSLARKEVAFVLSFTILVSCSCSRGSGGSLSRLPALFVYEI